MLLSLLVEDSRYLRLSEQQKVFVKHYCETQDKVASAHKAWKCKSDENAVTMANRLLSQAGVSQLVGKFVDRVDERVSRDELLSILGKRLRNASDDEKILGFTDRIIKIEGWTTKPGDAIPQTNRSDQELLDEVEK